MIGKPSGIYLITGEVDLRMGIDGYAHMIQDHYKYDPFNASMYCFTNKRHNKLKILYWDQNGFWLLYKRLEEKTFKWPSSDDRIFELSNDQFEWLLQGLNIEQKRAFKQLKREFV